MWRDELAGLDAVEELVADPVGLDDAPVERVGDPVRAGDQLEVGPGALEGARELGEAAVGLAGGAVLEQRPPDVGAAEAERVRRVGVAREEQRPAVPVTMSRLRRRRAGARRRR